MKFEKYFSDVRDYANDHFFSYDGGDGMDDFDGAFEFADYDSFSDYDNATGNQLGGTASAATSQPYILNVENTTASAVANVTILGAFSQLGTAAPHYGNTSAISITMGIANVTYTEFLYQSMIKPFTVGLTYIQSATSSQVLETVTVTQKDVNGNVASKVLTPTVDPYQQQTDKVAFKFEYRIDGYTNLTISQVLGNTNVKFYFYPSETVSVSRGLTGRSAVQNYGNPDVVRGNVLQVRAPRKPMRRR
jgi:hypothetical protein